MSDVTIVMYHYVREVQNSPYPKIKGLEFAAFKRQLDYLGKHYQFVTAEEVIGSVKGGAALPENACWLTFDDGYKDHIDYVLDELLARGIQGSFFPPVRPIKESVMLDVNSVHFVLACADMKDVVPTVNAFAMAQGIEKSTLDKWWQALGKADHLDTAEVVYVKRLLQHALPENIRGHVTTQLFEKYVGVSQQTFAESLYMSEQDLRKLTDSGMYVGCHGYNHYWLNEESYENQEKDIKQSLDFLQHVGAPITDWIMCYPYGGWNNDTLALVKKYGGAVGLTTQAAVANVNNMNPLLLPRMDTIDFPR